MNYKQIMAIVVAILSATAAASANLTDLFGAGVAKSLVSAATLLNTMLSSVLAVYSSTSQNVVDASNVDGVKVKVSGEAPQKIAALALDEKQVSISPEVGEERAVVQKAEEGATP